MRLSFIKNINYTVNECGTLKMDKDGIKSDLDYKERETKFILPPKQFLKRRTIFIEQCEDNIHFRGVYNIAISFSFLLILSITIKEYLLYGRFSPAFNLIFEKFGKFYITFIIWLGYNLLTFLCYYVFILWEKTRKKVQYKSILDNIFIVLLGIYYVFLFSYTPYLIYQFDIPFGTTMIILSETIRFVMKVHAFVRSNAPKVLSGKSDKKPEKLPTFSYYLFFLYIPTAVYRDEYPRNDHIRWNFVFYRLAELLWCIICIAHLYIYSIFPLFKDVCNKPAGIADLVLIFLESSIPAVTAQFFISFATLHATQNAVGEILRFGDRAFYLDWWNSRDMQNYYKKWNCVVGDWLYTYVMKDLCEILSPDRRNLAKIVTVTISGVVHEWMFITISGFFYPVVSIMMLNGALLSINCKVKSRRNYVHLVYLFCYSFGSGMLLTFWYGEYFARLNLPIKNEGTFVFLKKCFIYKY